MEFSFKLDKYCNGEITLLILPINLLLILTIISDNVEKGGM